VAICMYHDQALIPLKALDFDHGVNVTLGLPIIRTSPDHGTAYDIAGSGRASASSFLAALDLAQAKLGTGQVDHDGDAAPRAVRRSTDGMHPRLVIVGRAVREVDPRDIHSRRDQVGDLVCAGRADGAYLLGSRSVHERDFSSALGRLAATRY